MSRSAFLISLIFTVNAFGCELGKRLRTVGDYYQLKRGPQTAGPSPGRVMVLLMRNLWLGGLLVAV
jgi:hypothetical protein